MSYKTVLAHWDDTDAPRASLEQAGQIARAWDAHLTIYAFGLEPDIAAYSYGAPGVAVVAQESERARADAAEKRAAAEAWLAASGLRGEVRATRAPLGLLGEAMGRAAMRADLVVCAQPYEGEREEIRVRALEGALFQAAAPVLVVPPSTAKAAFPRVMVAWDRSIEALHALRGALGFLKAAEAVELVLVDPTAESADDEPGAEIAVMLSRHGVPVTVAQVPSVGKRVGEVLRSRALETGADLLVMGAYGHSRLREALIGGPTREILEHVPVPVLMAH
ncbi:MAG: universal stress protein [Paracoccaceae bacterium]